MPWILAAADYMYSIDMWGKVFVTQEEILDHDTIKAIMQGINTVDDIKPAIKKLEKAADDIAEEIGHGKVTKLVGALEGQGIKLSHETLTKERALNIDWAEVIENWTAVSTRNPEPPAKINPPEPPAKINPPEPPAK